MSALTCAEVRDLAPELALGVLGGAERAETVMHVNECARCQAYVLELTEAADALPLLAPEAEPPPGFEQRVVAGIRAGRWRLRRRWIVSISAVAAAVAIFSFTVVRLIESDGSSSHTAPVAVEMRAAGDLRPLGWAYVSEGGRYLAVGINYKVLAGNYTLQVRPARGPVATLGTITVDGNRGSWTGKSRQPLTKGSMITLFDASGREVCHGTVRAAG